MSSSVWRQEWLRGRKSLSRWAIAQLNMPKKLAAEKWREMHISSNEEKETWIEDYVQRETAGARKWVEDAEASVQQEQKDMKHAEIGGCVARRRVLVESSVCGRMRRSADFVVWWDLSHRHKVDQWLMVLTTNEASYIIVPGRLISILPINSTGLRNQESEKTFEQMMVAIRGSPSNFASSDDGKDEEDENEKTEQGKLREDDEPGWVMGTITKRYSSAWRGFDTSRGSLKNRHNQDGRMQLTISVEERRSTAHPKWWFELLFNRKRFMRLSHLHRQNLERW